MNDEGDFFRFELLQTQHYFFTLTNLGSSAAPTLELLDSDGNVVPLIVQGDGKVLLGPLDPGTYILHVGSWSSASSQDVAYQVEIELGGVSENPTPLTNGAAPAVSIRLVGQGPALIAVPNQAEPVSPNIATNTSATPTGLNNNLAALPMGLPANSALAASSTANDNRLVRLFGFGDRDRLFSMIDSILSRPTAESLTDTKAELSDSELVDILHLSRTNSEQSNFDDSAETSPSDATADEETSTGAVEAASEVESSVSSETTREPGGQQPLTHRSAGARRPSRRPQPKARPSDEPQPNAAMSPLAIALAASLASTLRERARREKELALELVRP